MRTTCTKKFLSLLLAALMVVLMIPFAVFNTSAALQGTQANGRSVIYICGALANDSGTSTCTVGSDGNDGLSDQTPVKNYNVAVSKLNALVEANTVNNKEGIIVICGRISHSTVDINPESGCRIVFTSFFEGCDYRSDNTDGTSGAKWLIADSTSTYPFQINCAGVTFEHMIFTQRKSGQEMFILNNHDFKIGEDVVFEGNDRGTVASSKAPLIILGRNNPATAETFNGTQNVEINGGEWLYIRGGDRISAEDLVATTYGADAEINITINGGTFTSPAIAKDNPAVVAPAGQSIYLPGSEANLTITGGTFKSGIFGFGFNYFTAAKADAQVACDVNINISGGEFDYGVSALQNADTENQYYIAPTGDFTLQLDGGDFPFGEAIKGEGTTGAKTLKYHSTTYDVLATGKFTISGFDNTINLDDKDFTLTYSANGGAGVASPYVGKPATINLSATEPTWAGHKFLGWSTEDDATEATYAAGASFEHKADITLYAVWREIGGVIFVNDAGDDNNTGADADNAVKTLTKAYSLLDLSKDNIVVISGLFTQNAVAFADGTNFEGSVTVTSVFDGVDYRQTNSAKWVVGEKRYVCWGETAFENVDINLTGKYFLTVAQCNPFTLGEGVNITGDAEAFNGTAIANGFSIIGAFQAKEYENKNDGAPKSRDVNVTVLSGEKIVILAGNRSTPDGNIMTGTYNITIGGTAKVGTFYTGSANKNGIKWGDVNVTLKDKASVERIVCTINVDVVCKRFELTWLDEATIDNISLTDDSFMPSPATTPPSITYTNGTKLFYENSTMENVNFETVKALFDESKNLDVNSFTITYDANGGIGAPTPTIKEEGKAAKLSKNQPTKQGFSFVGWDENKNATTPLYLSGDSFAKEADTTLFAIWKVKGEGTQANGRSVIYLGSSMTHEGTGDVMTVSDSNPGTAPTLPKASLNGAIAALRDAVAANTVNNKEGIIVLCGRIANTNKNLALDPGYSDIKITFTSYIDGVDYRGGEGEDLGSYAKWFLSDTTAQSLGVIELGGDTQFEYINFFGRRANYHQALFLANNFNFTIGDEVTFNKVASGDSNLAPIIIGGRNCPTEAVDFTGTQTITVNSGTWYYVRGGDRTASASIPTAYKAGSECNIVINGGTFTSNASAIDNVAVIAPVAQGIYEAGSKGTVTINGGTFAGAIYGYGFAYFSTTSAPQYNANVDIVINGGSFTTAGVAALQNANTANTYYRPVTGAFSLTLNGGDFPAITTFDGCTSHIAGDTTSKVYYVESKVDVTDTSKYYLTAFDNGPEIKRSVVYLKDGGVGDGTTADKAVGTLTDAFNALDLNKDATIVICGPFTQTADFNRAGTYTGKVTITSLYDGVEYRSPEESAAKFIVNPKRFVMYGAVTFENIDIEVTGSYYLIVAQCNPIVISGGVTITGESTGFTGDKVANAFTILGGFQKDSGSQTTSSDTAKPNVTVLSGDKILIVTHSRQLACDFTAKATVVVGGTANVSGIMLGGVNANGNTIGDIDLYVGGKAHVGLIQGSNVESTGHTYGNFTLYWDDGAIDSVDIRNNGTNITYASTSMKYSPVVTSKATFAALQTGIGTASASAAAKTYTFYTINYNLNGGTGSAPDTIALAGFPVRVTSTVPVYGKKVFHGWAESSTANNADCASGGFFTATQDTTLFAVFTSSGLGGTDAVSSAEIARYVAGSGNDTNDGLTPATAYKTFAKAVADFKTEGKGGVIVVVGRTTLDTGVYEATNEKIIVTSFYDGTDYRVKENNPFNNEIDLMTDTTGAMLFLKSGSATPSVFGGVYQFEYLNVAVEASKAVLAFAYNDFTINKEVKMFNGEKDDKDYEMPILIGGNYDLSSAAEFAGTQNITVNSGTWYYLLGGDMRVTTGNKFTSIKNGAVINIEINGGTFTATGEGYNDDAFAAGGSASFAAGSTVNLTINDGTFEGPVYAVGKTGNYDITNSGTPVYDQKTVVTVNGGAFRVGVLGLQNMGNSAAELSSFVEPGGDYEITANDTVTSLDGDAVQYTGFSGKGSSKFYYLASKVDIADTAKTATTGFDEELPINNTTPIYLSSTGNDSNMGTTPAMPVKTMKRAYDIAFADQTKDYAIVIMDTYTAATFSYGKAHTNLITVTSVYDNVDYRDTNGAEYKAGALRYVCWGPTLFDDITFHFTGSYFLFIAQHNPLTIGKGVEMKIDSKSCTGLTTGAAITIIGGYQEKQDNPPIISDEDVNLTILAGDKMCVLPYSRGTSLYGAKYTGDANITIGGTAHVVRMFATMVNVLGAEAGATILTVKDDAIIDEFVGGDRGGQTADSFTLIWRGGHIGGGSITGNGGLQAYASGAVDYLNGTSLSYTENVTKEANFAVIAGLFDTSKLINGTDHSGHYFYRSVITEANCCHTGLIHYTCINCGYSYDEIIPATGVHRYELEYIATKPSCTGNGFYIYKCTEGGCTATLTMTVTGAHKFGAEYVIKAATDTTDGIMGRKCSRCGFVYTTVVKAGTQKVNGVQYTVSEGNTLPEGSDIKVLDKTGSTSKARIEELEKMLGGLTVYGVYDIKLVQADATETDLPCKIQIKIPFTAELAKIKNMIVVWLKASGEFTSLDYTLEDGYVIFEIG